MTTKTNRLATYARRHHVTNRELARQMGIPHLYPMISLWSRGIRIPQLDCALRIEDVTGIPVRYWAKLRAERKAAKKAEPTP